MATGFCELLHSCGEQSWPRGFSWSSSAEWRRLYTCNINQMQTEGWKTWISPDCSTGFPLTPCSSFISTGWSLRQTFLVMSLEIYLYFKVLSSWVKDQKAFPRQTLLLYVCTTLSVVLAAWDYLTSLFESGYTQRGSNIWTMWWSGQRIWTATTVTEIKISIFLLLTS